MTATGGGENYLLAHQTPEDHSHSQVGAVEVRQPDPAGSPDCPIRTRIDWPVPTPRIADPGGIGMVPGPGGLAIPGLTEEVMSACLIGWGCGARTWEAFYDQDGSGAPDARARFISNVGRAPTERLARRDLVAQGQGFSNRVTSGTNCPVGDYCWGWTGTANTWTDASGRTFTAVNANDGATVPNGYYIAVQGRQGKRTVYLEYQLAGYSGSLQAGTTPPAALTVSALVKKVKKALRKKGWNSVPQTVLP